MVDKDQVSDTGSSPLDMFLTREGLVLVFVVVGVVFMLGKQMWNKKSQQDLLKEKELNLKREEHLRMVRAQQQKLHEERAAQAKLEAKTKNATESVADYKKRTKTTENPYANIFADHHNNYRPARSWGAERRKRGG